jgi:putative FmdB family regulatory protein
MPTYAFTCAGCGPFEAWRPVDEAAAVLQCPSCGREATRRFTAPGVARTPTALRGALDREDRSAHEPEVVASKSGRPMPFGHRHAHAH